MNFGIFNPGGLNSAKSACISNIFEVNDLKVIIVSETGSSGNQIPVINAKMKSFHRNRRRDAQCRGGIAIFVHEDLAEDAVLLEKGAEEDNDEFVIIKINTFSPPMVVVGVYGSQENGPRSETRDRWKRIFALMNKYKSQGCLVVMGGDLNCAVGNNLGLKTNHPSVSAGGQEVIKEAENGDWFLVNSISDEDQKSHYDRSSKSSRNLDYVFTNMKDCVEEVSLDEKRMATPYLVHMTKNVPTGRKFTDHKSIIFSMNLKRVTEKPKSAVRFIKSEESIERFKELTDEIAEDLLPELLVKDVSPEEILRKIKRRVKKAKYSAFKPMKTTGRKVKILDDNNIFWKKTQTIEKELKKLQDMKTNNKIFATRKSRMLEERKQELSAMYNTEGEVMEDKDNILNELMKYNEQLLSRKPHNERFQEVFQLKKKMVETLEKTEIKFFETITEEEFAEVVRKIKKKNKAMFQDFLQSGPVFKHLIYHLTRVIFETEEVPERVYRNCISSLVQGEGGSKKPDLIPFSSPKKLPVPDLRELSLPENGEDI